MRYLLILLLSVIGPGSSPSDTSGADQVVKIFLKKDFDGEFLRQNDWLTNHLANAHAIPAWDNFSVIKAFAIRETQCEQYKGVVTVEYHRIGEVIQDSSGLKFVAVPDTIKVHFSVVKADTLWRIEHPGINPQVGVPTIKKLFPAGKIQGLN